MKPLKPVMAAFLAASSFTSALPGTAFADEPSQIADAAAREKAILRDQEFVARLVALVDRKKEVRADIGARLVKFILNKETGRQYLTDGLLNDKLQLKGAVAEAKNWPEKNQAEPAKVAALYYVMGPEADPLPAWAPAGYDDEFKTNVVWSGRLAAALFGNGWSKEKRVAQSGAANGTTDLLDDAAKLAQDILKDARSHDEIHGSIVANDTTRDQPPTTKKQPNPLDATGSGFGFDDLYKTGARWEKVYGPHDDGYRTLSIKVYTAKDGDHLINKVGIVDITQPDEDSPSLTQFIDASHTGETDIVMREGGRHYTVTVAADGSVTLKRAGTKDGEGGGISTSKNELSALRDAQIMSRGTVMVGGEPYYVLGQGGVKGSFLFFSQAEMQAAPTGNAHPALMGDVVEATRDGSAPITGEVPLGNLRDGSAWHLVFNMKMGMWVVVPGEAKKKDPPAGTPGGSTSTVTSPGPGNPDPTDPMAAATTLDELIGMAKADKANPWVEDGGNGGLDADVRAQIRIMSNERADKMTHFNVLFDPDLKVKNNHFEFQAKNNGVLLLQVRGFKKYVALQYATGTQYYDLNNFVNYVQHVYDASLAYAQAGSYAVSNGQMQDVTSADIVEDILTRYMKVKAGDPMLATIRDRIKKHAKDSGFIVNGDTKTLYLGVGEAGRTIWPEDIASGDTGTNEKMTGLRGPGTAVEVTGGEPGKFQKEMDAGMGRVSTLVQTENHAAIYASSEDETYQGATSTVKVWSVMIEYKNSNGLPSRSKALAVFGGGHNRYSLPKGIHMQGLTDLELPASTQLMMQYGSNQENGAIAAYRFVLPDAQGGQNAKDKEGNCAGPVLWWGDVTKEQAQAACESDSKIR